MAKAKQAKPKAVKSPVKASDVKKVYKEAMNKTQLLTTIAETTHLTKKTVADVLNTLSDIVSGHLNKRGVGYITLPGLLKIEVKKKPATKARKGISPFTGEPTVFKAKPARRVVKVKALKKLKEMAE